jgi:DNA-binding CsgD family transcriptional regulator
MGRRNKDMPPTVSKPTVPADPINLYPLPIRERPPETRDTILADLQAGFASLTDEELRLARMWLYGRSMKAVCRLLKRDRREVRRLYRSMRRKIYEAILGVAQSPRAHAQPVTNNENGHVSPPSGSHDQEKQNN